MLFVLLFDVSNLVIQYAVVNERKKVLEVPKRIQNQMQEKKRKIKSREVQYRGKNKTPLFFFRNDECYVHLFFLARCDTLLLILLFGVATQVVLLFSFIFFLANHYLFLFDVTPWLLFSFFILLFINVRYNHLAIYHSLCDR